LREIPGCKSGDGYEFMRLRIPLGEKVIISWTSPKFTNGKFDRK